MLIRQLKLEKNLLAALRHR